MRVAIDIEANNLLPFTSRIWCASVYDVDSGGVFTVTDRSRFMNEVGKWTEIIGHNLLGFDYWAILKCWDIQLPYEKCFDTLTWSRYLWPDRPWGHSLEDWGSHLGIPKLEHKDFTQYTEEMKTYCERDAHICAAVYKELLKEKNHVS